AAPPAAEPEQLAPGGLRRAGGGLDAPGVPPPGRPPRTSGCCCCSAPRGKASCPGRTSSRAACWTRRTARPTGCASSSRTRAAALRPGPPAPPPPSAFPGLPAAGAADGDASGAALPDDVAFRICAIREAFEEAGVLLLRPRGSRPSAPEPGRALAPPPGLAAWRARVRRDPRHFLRLCAHLDCTPDVWALHDWSAWLTPFVVGGGRRFDTAFFLCCLREPPPVLPDQAEVVGYQWSSPPEATESFISEEIWLAPPQFYEIRRLQNFASLSDLHKFCLDRAIEGPERWLPITCLTADGRLQLLPGDELYLEDSYFLENPLSTEKKTEEVMKEGKKFHRIVIHSPHVYSIHVTVQSKCKHVYPKNYVVSKSRL
uniref:Acyl-coenzyme A diphosphatase NUDT19 n=1 Tax=Equus asinus TaxID=9793 RepID=A0A9L0J4P2_EQUAS